MIRAFLTIAGTLLALYCVTIGTILFVQRGGFFDWFGLAVRLGW